MVSEPAHITRLADLRAKLAARERVHGMEDNVKAIRAEIAKLEAIANG